MEAVVLVGGQGTRLRPLTLTRPKPLLPVAGRPLIERALEALPHDVDAVYLAAGYRLGDLRAWARRYAAATKRHVEVVAEDEPLGTGGAIRNAALGRVTGPFIALNGDTMSMPPLGQQRELLTRHGGRAALALMHVEDPSRFGAAELDGPRIRRFVEKPEPGAQPSNLVNAGAYVLTPDVLSLIPPGRAVNIEREVFPILAAAGTLLGLTYEGAWLDCGTPASYLAAHGLVLQNQPYVGPGARMQGSWKDWASLEAGALVEGGASVERSVLLPGARIHRGAEVVRSILGEGAVVAEGARVVDCLLGDHAVVGPGRDLSGANVGVKEILE